MNRLNRSIVLAALLSVCGVHQVSGFAQMDIVDDRDDSRSSLSAVRVYDAAHSAQFDTVERAANVTIAPVHHPVVELMLVRSATFRRQVSRIAGAAHLSVEIRSDPAPGTRAQGLTRIVRRPGGLVATVYIDPCARTAELIAHEFEHIIEQLDGVDLPLKSRRRASGVHRAHDMVDVFETTRAIAIGQRVAGELGKTP